jgi:hypothetical protein
MSEPTPPAPAPRRVVDGLMSATLARPYWLLWRLGDDPALAGLRAALAGLGRTEVVADSLRGLALPAPSEIVTVCRAADLDDLPPELEASQLVCTGDAPRRRGLVHVADLAQLRAMLSRDARVSSTSTYHEV